MVYAKPEVLDTQSAQGCIKGHNKEMALDDSGHIGVQGTSTAYESDE
jgi:hypothetical protein